MVVEGGAVSYRRGTPVAVPGEGLEAAVIVPIPLRRLFVKQFITESVYKVVLKKSIPAQIRQLIRYHYEYEEYVDRCVRELTCARRLYKHVV